MRKTGIDAARQFIQEFFPDCEFAVLAGSASRGEETPTSDLDIVIFQKSPESYRESFEQFGWRIEAFIHNHQSYIKEFQSEREKGRPILGNMISQGIVIKTGSSYVKVKKNAVQHVLEGPAPLTEDYIRASRYFNYDLLDDFIDSRNEVEAIMTLNSLSLQIADFILRYHGQWSGRGKGLARALRTFDEKIYNEYFEALNQFYKNRNKQPFHEFVEKVYEPLGGGLFNGFSSRK